MGACGPMGRAASDCVHRQSSIYLSAAHTSCSYPYVARHSFEIFEREFLGTPNRVGERAHETAGITDFLDEFLKCQVGAAICLSQAGQGDVTKQFVCFAHLSTFGAITFSIKIPRVLEAKRRDLVAHALLTISAISQCRSLTQAAIVGVFALCGHVLLLMVHLLWSIGPILPRGAAGHLDPVPRRTGQ